MWTDRSKIIIGEQGIEKLKNSSCLIFGLGGVGSYAAEAIARAGVGKIGLCDFDRVDETNINRQLYALKSTVGKLKVDVSAQRILDINSNVEICKYPLFYGIDTSTEVPLDKYDFVIDAIDNITAKLMLAERCENIISSMGTGNKLHPEMLEIADIYKTSVCPLARVMRRELKERGVKRLTVVYSKEEPMVKSQPPGSISFVPPVSGMLMAGHVIRELLKK